MELQIARGVFAWERRRSSRADATARLAAGRDAILALARARNPADLSRRVLIERLRGLEDSSRHWSVWMTLDHLRIVNLAIAETIRLLGRGEIPSRPASTAAVKPNPSADATTVEEFSRSCDEIANRAAELPDLRTTRRYAHPWFGPLDAAGWHFMAGFHLRLHQRQIETILGQPDAPRA